MQGGCMQRNSRKEGPDVWQFRCSETRLDCKRFYHKKIVGTVEQYPDEDAARRSVVGLVSELNADGRPTKSGVRYRGRRPYWGEAILRKYIPPAAQRVGIQKRFEWHTFRHSYSTVLRSVGTEFKVMQELLRHSSFRSVRWNITIPK